MPKATVRKVGSSVRASRTARVHEGDVVYLTKTPNGFKVTPDEPDFEETMKIAERVMARYQNALRELSPSPRVGVEAR